jgi:hypothetical protein
VPINYFGDSRGLTACVRHVPGDKSKVGKADDHVSGALCGIMEKSVFGVSLAWRKNCRGMSGAKLVSGTIDVLTPAGSKKQPLLR